MLSRVVFGRMQRLMATERRANEGKYKQERPQCSTRGRYTNGADSGGAKEKDNKPPPQ